MKSNIEGTKQIDINKENNNFNITERNCISMNTIVPKLHFRNKLRKDPKSIRPIISFNETPVSELEKVISENLVNLLEYKAKHTIKKHHISYHEIGEREIQTIANYYRSI